MLLALFLLAVGAVILALGAEAAVAGGFRLAVAAGIPAFAVGALLFGIDFEGTGAALLAAGRNQPAISAGEAFGTIIFLFSAAFGAALLVSRKPLDSPSPIMVLAPVMTLTACGFAISNGEVSRAEGVLLVLLYAGYVAVVVGEGRALRQKTNRLEGEAGEARGPTAVAMARTLGGLVAVLAGAWLLVEGAVRLLPRTGLSPGFVGAAVVATLAGLDEVFLEVLPVRRGMPELATGNLFGTAAAFTSVVPGLAALIHPLQMDTGADLAFLGAATLYTIVAFTFLLRERAGKALGVVVLCGYAAWLAYAASL